MTPIQIVLFDLGSTLIYSKDPWPPIYRQADRELTAVLQRAGIRVDLEGLFDGRGSLMEFYYSDGETGSFERTMMTVLGQLLADQGFPHVSRDLLRSALDAEYAVTQTNWVVEEDTHATLETLRQAGYRMGLISNTSDDQNAQQLVDRWGLRGFFEIITTSAALGIRKPDRRIFQPALEHFDLPVESFAMVGDSLPADVEGANRLGMFSIWITRRVAGPESAIRPRATIAALSELPGLLRQRGS